MNFINNFNITPTETAVAGFVLGFIIGALLMKYWRKYRETFEQKWGWDSYHQEAKRHEELKKDFTNLEYERNTYRSEVKRLQQLPEIAERLEALAKIDAEIKERLEENHKLRKENGKLKSDKLIQEQKQAEEEAKAKRQAKREQKKDADDSLSDYEDESESIGKKPPKNGI